ncbi:MAG TPA: hypothetical protein VHW93_03255 [Acidimicrobiales bacterium]|nr:hypothetical protein [Acidimicrobiales bacterium]
MDKTEKPAGRLARLEGLMAGLAEEVRTERLVVIDPDGRERLTAQVEGSTVVLCVGLGEAEGDRDASAVIYAQDDPDLGPGVGVQLWAAGDSVVEVSATRQPDRRWRVVVNGPGDILSVDEPVAANG